MKKAKQPKILIYMPALNEADSIYKVLISVKELFANKENYMFLVVNDGSIDETKLEAERAGVPVITHSYNKGVGAAFQTAVNFALKIKADILVSIDADGQFDINQIEELVNPILKKTVDFSIGNRFEVKRPKDMPRIKFWGNKQVNRIVSFVSKTKILDASCGFRAYSKECLLSLNLEGNFTYTHETILDLLNKGFRVAQIPVKVTYFHGRISRVANNLFTYGFRTSSIIFKSLKDYKPLSFFMFFAFILLLLALIFGGWTLIYWITKGTISPYKSFGILGLSLLGMSLMVTIFAFMADMLGRIRNNQEKILYFLKKNHFEKN